MNETNNVKELKETWLELENIIIECAEKSKKTLLELENKILKLMKTN